MTVEADNVAKRDRSPAFPYVGLEKAVELTRALHKTAKRFDVPLSGAAKDWGLAATSSSTLRTAAALQAYGLAEQTGSGDARRIRVSELGWRILEDPDPAKREAYLAQAALNSPIIAEYAKTWSGGRPDDDHAIFHLKDQSGFTEEGAPKFLRVFDETKRFFPRSNNDKPGDSGGAAKPAQPPKPEAIYGGTKVGDWVQWEMGGALQFSEPKRVVEVHESGDWVFVEGSQTGVPMSETIVQAAAGPEGARREPPVLERAPARPGEAEWLRGPLTRETSYRLLISGVMGPKEIGKLITLLKAQKAVLADDDDQEAEET